MREWNARSYHQVSTPQFDWGTVVLERLPLEGNEVVFDIGCGTGRLTEKLLERLPRGMVVAIDLSFNMLETASRFLRPTFGSHVQLVMADASMLPGIGAADAVFSTATFHWVRDHPRLFRSLYSLLKPGGRLVAQCGGGPNIARLRDRAAALMHEPRFAPYFTAWQEPWEFADAETTARRLEQAGFTDSRTSVVAASVIQPDFDSFRTFITTVICRPHLACLPDATLRDAFVQELTEQAATDTPPFELDYWRLNIEATRPLASVEFPIRLGKSQPTKALERTLESGTLFSRGFTSGDTFATARTARNCPALKRIRSGLLHLWRLAGRSTLCHQLCCESVPVLGIPRSCAPAP